MKGGSGNFTWASSNETVAMVTTKGVVTAGQVRGNSTVLARDVQNPFRYGEIKVRERSEIMEASIFVQGTTFICTQVKL